MYQNINSPLGGLGLTSSLIFAAGAWMPAIAQAKPANPSLEDIAEVTTTPEEKHLQKICDSGEYCLHGAEEISMVKGDLEFELEPEFGSPVLFIDQLETPITEAKWLSQGSQTDSSEMNSTIETDENETNEDDIDASPSSPAPEQNNRFNVDDEIDITVTGTRTRRPIFKSPANITVIDDEELQKGLPQDIEDLIRYEPGITVNRDVTYGISDFNIRGLERNRVLLQLDGIRVPTYFEFGSSVLGRNYVDIDALQSVEIIRGSASALYGSDALGGVVSYFTPDPSDLLAKTDREYYFSISPEYRSANDAFAVTGTVAFRANPDLEGLLRYTYRHRNERDINNNEGFADPFDGTTHNFLGKLVYNLSDSSSLSLTGEYFRDKGAFETNPNNLNLVLSFPGINILSDTTDAVTGRSRVSLTYNYDNPDSDDILQYSRVQLYYQGSEYLETRTRNDISFFGPPTPRSRTLNNTFVDQIYGAEAQFRSDFFTGSVAHKLTYGFDISNTFNQRIRDGGRTNLNTGITSNTIGPDTFPVKDFPDSDTLRVGVYLQDEIEFWDGRLTLIPGVRFDYYRLNAKPDALFLAAPGAAASDLSDSAISPSLGLVYEVTPQIALVGRYGKGFRGPNYVEINSGFTNTLGGYRTLSNPDLEPETSHTFEVGVKGDFDKAKFGLTGFYSLYNDFIFGATEGSTAGTEPAGCFPAFRPGCIQVFQSQNLDRVRIYGLEAKGEYRFNESPDGFKLFGGVSWVIGEDDQNNEPLETVNPVEAVLGIGYSAPENAWGAELITTIVGEARTANTPGEFVPNAYALLDLIGYVNINKNLSLNAGIYNIFDTQYVRYTDARRLNDVVNTADPTFGQRRGRITQPGINVGIGLTFSY